MYLHYTGPFVDPQVRQPVSFPWEKIDGRPLIYASMGTLQNRLDQVFRIIAQACEGLDAKLVISLGGGMRPEELGILTTLESLSEGVPLVAIPLGNDQPGVAARTAYRNAGIVIPLKKLSVSRLRRAVQAVLADAKYKSGAKSLQAAISSADGSKTATDLIENAFGFRREVEASVPHTQFS